MPTTVQPVPEKSSWHVRPWRLATCITGTMPLRQALVCNDWSAGWNRRVSHGVGHFRRIFRVEWDNSQQPPSARDIHVSYGVEMLTDDYFVLSQYTHLTDRHTDGQNCDSNTVRCITCSRKVKTRFLASGDRPHNRQPLDIKDCASLWSLKQTNHCSCRQT